MLTKVFEGQVLTQLVADQALTVVADGGAWLQLLGDIQVREPSGEYSVLTVGAVTSMLHKELGNPISVVVLADGGVTLVVGGVSLNVGSHPDWESWTAGDSGGLLLVSGPQGELTSWLEPSSPRSWLAQRLRRR